MENQTALPTYEEIITEDGERTRAIKLTKVFADMQKQLINFGLDDGHSPAEMLKQYERVNLAMKQINQIFKFSEDGKIEAKTWADWELKQELEGILKRYE